MIYTRKVMPNFIYQYKLTKRGYWDICRLVRMSDTDKTVCETMTPYPAITPTVTTLAYGQELSFAETLLPDYSLLTAQTGLLAKAGVTYMVTDGQGNIDLRSDGILDNMMDSGAAQTYNLFVKDDKPLLSLSENVNGGVYCNPCAISQHAVSPLYRAYLTKAAGTTLSGSSLQEVAISSGGYLISDYLFPAQATTLYNFDMVLKVKTGADVSGRQILFKIGDYWFGIDSGVFAFSDGVSVVKSQTNISANTAYWFKAKSLGTAVRVYMFLYLLDNGSYNIDNLPSQAQWKVGGTTQFATAAADDNRLMYSDATYPWLGSLDLSNGFLKIQISGETPWNIVWKPLEVVS